jgi:uncharacterized protein with NAD-binding domain and iron-sulfur cluster
MSGIVAEDVAVKGFIALDDRELSEFLRQYGAEEFTLGLEHSPFLRGWYDAAFAYEYQGTHRIPNLAAGTGVHGMIRLIATFKESIAFKMQAGMGDTIFGPLYDVLKHRGVTFEFFSEVGELQLAEDKSHVAAIKMVRQVKTKEGRPYQPLVDVANLPCWPNEPLWDQLIDGDALKTKGINFEHGGRSDHATDRFLQYGTDFDRIVLAIPAPALGEICQQISDHSEKFRTMLANCAHTMTQAGQVWTTRSLADLGARFTDSAIATSFVEPVDTYCDMSHLLPREEWGADGPRGVAYFCGVLRDQESQEVADDQVAQDILKLLDHDGLELWPNAISPTGSFDWSKVFAPNGGSPRDRLDAQYIRANWVATEHYVLSPKGSIRFRMAEDELVTDEHKQPGTGCTNLYLAGDWVLNGMNGGCVEAATMSGMRAAKSICKTPKFISGENADWLTRIEQ